MLRLQTGLEFMLILSIVSLLGLAALMMYGRSVVSIKGGGHAFAMNTSLQSAYAQAGNKPEVWVYVPLNSVLYAENRMQVDLAGCLNGSAEIAFSSDSAAFSEPLLRNVSVEGIKAISVGFEPYAEGSDTIAVNYSLRCGNASAIASERFYTFAAPRGEQTLQSGNAYLERLKEYVEFGKPQDNITETKEWVHCTKVNYWTGVPLGIQAQCGTSDAWDFMTFDAGCLAPYYSYSDTYCVLPIDTGSAYESQGSGAARYLIGADIGTASGLLNATLEYNSSSSAYLNGIRVGNASVSSLSYSAQGYPTFLVHNASLGTADRSKLDAYLQAHNNLYSILRYYNLTGISGDTASAIGEARSALDMAAEGLISSFSDTSYGCNESAGGIDCPALSPFTYDIAMRVNASYGIGNSTGFYEGSVIRVLSR